MVSRHFFIGRKIGLDRFEAVTRERLMESPWEIDSVATRSRSSMSGLPSKTLIDGRDTMVRDFDKLCAVWCFRSAYT
jgi:hypothetical protein